MNLAQRLGLLMTLVLGCRSACAQSVIANYQGRVSMGGTNFNGSGHFVFSISDTNGAIFWASGDFPSKGATNLPRGVVHLEVKAGVYSARLGDTAAGLPALDLQSLRRAGAPRLRIWFSDGRHGWQPAGEDVPLSPAVAAVDPARLTEASLAELQALRAELRELRALVTSPQAPRKPEPAGPRVVTVSVGDAPAHGRTNAPLVLVEFNDFQCSFCRQFQEQVLPELVKNYVDPGKLRIVARSLPLRIHSNAEPAARAALCAEAQNQYWAMRQRLFAAQAALDSTNLLRIAAELKLDVPAFRSCLEANRFAERVKLDAQAAAAVGIDGTPSFVLGRSGSNQVTGLVIVGAQPYAVFEAEIRKLLAQKP